MIYKNLKKFVCFIGSVRTGHSLVAALLDTHPNIAISIRVNPLFRMTKGYSQTQLFDRIVNSSSMGTKRIGGYEYSFKKDGRRNKDKLLVLGDSACTHKNMRNYFNPKLFDRFNKYIGVPIYWLWVLRDPFETIHSATKMSKQPLDHMLQLYWDSYNLTHQFYEKNKKRSIIIYLEDLIDNPQKQLERMLDLLEVPYDNRYLNKCSKFVFSKPNIVENKKGWTKWHVERVKTMIDMVPELKRYKK
jgi:hypothetical protein